MRQSLVLECVDSVSNKEVEQHAIASFEIDSISDLVPTYYAELLTRDSNTSDEQIDFTSEGPSNSPVIMTMAPRWAPAVGV
jgi:hypothetical protein